MMSEASCMSYKQLGSSGLVVSKICLGTMTFGYHERPGNCSEEQSHKLLNRYTELGGNFIDTADVYCNGQSERIIGTWLKSGFGLSREKIILATKARFDEGKQGRFNGACLSRKHLVSQVNESLERLQTDYIDLYQWHCWDKMTPVEESLRTMDDLIRSGKILYFGVSNLCGWQLQKVVDICKFMGLKPCISIQQQYNLVNREVELEVQDVCCNEGLGLLPWSPLKGGWLTGKFDRQASSAPENTRVHYASTHKLHNQSHPTWDQFSNNEQMWKLLTEMKNVAINHNRSVAQVAIKWLLNKPAVSSVIIGAKTIAQLEDNIGAGDSKWEITEGEMKVLDACSSYDVPYPYELINRLARKY